MIDKVNINHILFLDIETAPLVYKYGELQEPHKKLWDLKFQYNKEVTPEQQYSKAGIFAEFAKVICVCVGFFSGTEFRIKTYCVKDVVTVARLFQKMRAESALRDDQIVITN